MAQYRFDENLLRKSRRKVFLAYAPGILAGCVFAFLPIAWDMPGSIVIKLSIGLPLLLVGAGLATIGRIRRQEEQLASFVLEVTEAGITRQLKEAPYVAISAAAVREISKNKAGDFVVRGSDKYAAIVISGALNANGELEKQLEVFSPIVPGTDALKSKYHWFVFLATGTLFDCVIISGNKLAAGIAAALVVGVMIALFSQTWKSASFKKRSQAWLYLFFAGVTLFCLYVKLFPQAH